MLMASKDFYKTLKARLNSSRRVLNFDNDQIILLPFIEHKNISTSLDNIRFLIDKTGKYKNIKDFNSLEWISSDIKLNYGTSGSSYTLHHRSLKGTIVKTVISKFSFNKLTIDHNPSLYILFYLAYIKNTSDYKKVKAYSDDVKVALGKTLLKGKQMNKGTVVKAAKSLFTPAIEQAYANILKSSVLEIAPVGNNSANLSLESLQYFCKNSATTTE